jgi:hypothetical protein
MFTRLTPQLDRTLSQLLASGELYLIGDVER